MIILKTITYFFVHIGTAIGIAYCITGQLRSALAVGLIEPTVQMVTFYIHERLWLNRKAKAMAMIKTLTYSIVHITTAIILAYCITGSLYAAIAIGTTEPLAQMGTFYLHERLWKWMSPKPLTAKPNSLLSTIRRFTEHKH